MSPLSPLDTTSPCNNVCTMLTSQEAAQLGLPAPLCKGCARSIEEIAQWSTLSEADKHALKQQLPSRQLVLKSLAAIDKRTAL